MMGKLSRLIFLCSAALLLGLILTIVLDTPKPVCATCGSKEHVVRSEHTDLQTSDTKNGVTTNTDQVNIISVVVGDQGDISTENSSFNKNSDGSSESHENMHNEDPEGCIDGDGEPMKADTKRDVKKDTKGNTKEHREQTVEKNGKCIKITHEWEWNEKGELIKDTGLVETEVPCPSKYSLEVYGEGEIGGWIHYKFEKLVIPLARQGDVYTGSAQGELKTEGSNQGNTTEGTYLKNYEVTAQQDEFGVLQFTIHISVVDSRVTITTAEGGAASGNGGPSDEGTLNFPLEADDGASYSYGDGQGTWTYTLREQNEP
jgi:hypothetical protein